MAKNKNKSIGYNPADFAQQQENIRKAKGNPNKNVHRKKNGSNYGGYASASKKEAERKSQPERKRDSIFDMNHAQWIIFAVLVAAAIVAAILANTVFKGTRAELYVPSVAMGVPCCFLAYVGFTNRHKKHTTFQTVILVLLGLCGLYAVFGLMGLLGLLSA